MKRVEANGNWSLFCPNEAPGLPECWGEEFEALYEKYEKEGRARRVIPAQKLWYAILEAQVETGGPFMVYKDSSNSMLLEYIFLRCLTFVQENQTNRTWELSSPPTSAPKSSSIPRRTRLLSATLHLLHYQHSFRMASTTSRSFMT